MFGITKRKCISFFRCESMWTSVLMLVVALLFFVPFIFDYIFMYLSDPAEMVVM
jgi:hypothetical protein